MPGALRLISVDDRTAYFLDGAALHTGEPVELMLEDGQWLQGVFEWSGNQVKWPAFRFKLGGVCASYSEKYGKTAVVALPPDAILRRHP